MDRDRERDVRSSGVSKSLPEDAPQQGKEKRGIPEQHAPKSGLAPFVPHKQLKVEHSIRKEILRGVSAIRIYPSELNKEINSTIERREKPRLLIKIYEREKTGEPEVALVLCGAYHIEDLSYWQKNPKDWVSWGEIVLPKEGAKDFVLLLLKMLEAPAEQIKALSEARGIHWMRFPDLERLGHLSRIHVWKIVSVKRHRKVRR